MRIVDMEPKFLLRVFRLYFANGAGGYPAAQSIPSLDFNNNYSTLINGR